MTNDTKPTSYLLSGIDGDHWLCKFDVAEILGYSRTLTAPEEASVGGYLAAKYGIKTAYLRPLPAASLKEMHPNPREELPPVANSK